MGSWANSLQVRHRDARVVAEAIRAVLTDEGYLPDASPPRAAAVPVTLRAEWPGGHSTAVGDFPADSGPVYGDPDGPREVCVYQPVQGWVGVLDSGDVTRLAPALAGRLDTEAILVLVNDSDSWVYELYRGGVRIDAFDSSGEDDDDGAPSPELRAAAERGDQREVERLAERDLLAHAPQGPVVLHDGTALRPPELALLGQRVRAGHATFRERWRYWWLTARFLFRLLTGRLRPDRLPFGFDIPRATPLDDAALQRHLAHLLAVFPQASEVTLRRLLPQSRFPAEDLLADFLATVGLPPLYAQLSHGYLEDFTDGELADAGIRLASTLRFLPAIGPSEPGE